MKFINTKKATKEIEEVVLSSHAEAGLPMFLLASNKNKSKVIECWGFDCLYRQKSITTDSNFIPSEKWLSWLKENQDKHLYIYAPENSGTYNESNELKINSYKQNITNLHVEYSKHKSINMEIYRHNKAKRRRVNVKTHFLIPITHWSERLSRLNWN